MINADLSIGPRPDKGTMVAVAFKAPVNGEP